MRFARKALRRNRQLRGIYALGPKLLVLAEEYRRSFTMRDRVLPYLEQLVRATGETAIYCERYQQDGCVTIERRESPHQTRTVIETGVPRPLYAGSSALAILAMLPQEEILSVLQETAARKIHAAHADLGQSDSKKTRSGSAPWLRGERSRKIFVHCRYRRALRAWDKTCSAASRSSGPPSGSRQPASRKSAEPSEASLVIYLRLMGMKKHCAKKVCCDDCKW